ncbi:unnamed protein product [Absidia cylindrospora]
MFMIAEFRKYISDAKSNGIDHHTYMGLHGQDKLKKDTAMVYSAYEEKLEKANMIDFDGLLLKGRDLIKHYPQTVDFVTHVLVDEFQDTNALQYEILLLLTHHGEKSITVVGDPDQSIFGWRFADKKNFDNMEFDYKGTTVVNLKENYRSTKNILSNATHVVSLDRARKPREFFTNNHAGMPISTLHTNSETDEANVVAQEIKRIIKFSNGLVNYKDIAILFRMNHLTLNFEQALLRADVPFILVSGTRFLDRMEIKDILAYLSFFYNPMDTGAFVRLVNAPKRGLGDVSVKKILALTETKNWTMIETLQRVVNHHPEASSIRITGKARSGLQSILTLHLEIEERMQRMESPASLLKWIVEATGYIDYLKTSYEKDHESKTENVQELINFAHRQIEDQLDAENVIDPVGQFLESVTLCGDAKEHDEANEGRVSLITMHASKGLEWACVFVAGCEEGIVPMKQTDDPEEESRLMYVAMTRAKCFLYCTTATHRRQWGMLTDTDLSSFLCVLPADGYQNKTPAWNSEVRSWVAQVLRLPYVEDANLQLEDDGREFNRIATGDRYDSYGVYDDYDHYDDFDDDGFDHYDDFSQNDTQYTTDFRNATILPLDFGIKPASSLHRLLPPPPSKTSASSTRREKETRIKAEHVYTQQQLGSKTIKTENTQQQTTLKHIFRRQTSEEKVKLEPALTTMDLVNLKQKREAINIKRESPYSSSSSPSTSNTTFSIQQKKQKRNTTILSFDQCITKGLQLAGTGKSSFSMEDAILAVEKEIQANQIESISTSKIKGNLELQLDQLVRKGAIFRIKKAGNIRFFVAE